MKIKKIGILIVFSVLILSALTGCGKGRKTDKKRDKPTEAVAHITKEQPQRPTPTPTPTPQPPKILEKYNDILKINPYVSGWLTIDDTLIDNPVVYTPQDQNYFLHKAIDGSDESKGTLFIAVNWGDGLNQTLIYGHNMKDGTAFGSLLKFADESYGMNHHTIQFDTLYEEKEYELYGAFYSQIAVEDLETDEDRAEREQAVIDNAVEGEEVNEEDLTLDDLGLYGEPVDEDIYRQEKDEDDGRFRYYYYTDLRNRDDFEYFAKNVKERALYDTGVTAEWGDEFITLSTCSYQVKNGRFVVVGIRHNDD